MKGKLFNEALNYIDHDLVDEYFDMKQRLNEESAPRGGIVLRIAAVAAVFCIVISAVLTPHFMQGQDPSFGVVPPLDSTDQEKPPLSSDNGENAEKGDNDDKGDKGDSGNSWTAGSNGSSGDKGQPGAPGESGDPDKNRQGVIAYEALSEYDLNAEFIELKIYFGVGSFDYNSNVNIKNADLMVVYDKRGANSNTNFEGTSEYLIKQIPKSEFTDGKYPVDEDGGFDGVHFETVKIPTSVFKEDSDDKIIISLTFMYMLMSSDGNDNVDATDLNLNYINQLECSYEIAYWGLNIEMDYTIEDNKIKLEESEKKAEGLSVYILWSKNKNTDAE